MVVEVEVVVVVLCLRTYLLESSDVVRINVCSFADGAKIDAWTLRQTMGTTSGNLSERSSMLIKLALEKKPIDIRCAFAVDLQATLWSNGKDGQGGDKKTKELHNKDPVDWVVGITEIPKMLVIA